MKWLEEIEKRNNERTQGTWKTGKYTDLLCDGKILIKEIGYDANAKFIVHAPTDITRLIKALRFVHEALNEAETAHMNGDDYVLPVMISETLDKLERGEF